MKSYPSIPKEIQKGLPCYVFDKLDGSQIRAEWSRKKGFYKFGSKKRLVDSKSLFLEEAPELVLKKYSEDLNKVFKKERYEKVVCFFEFWGENSFAGTHQKEKHTVTLFDIAPFKKGILPPKEFLKLAGHLDIPKLLYHGNVNQPLVDELQSGSLEDMTFEGVICKAKNSKKTMMPIMFKIKNKAWVNKLKNFCDGDENLFKQLL